MAIHQPHEVVIIVLGKASIPVVELIPVIGFVLQVHRDRSPRVLAAVRPAPVDGEAVMKAHLPLFEVHGHLDYGLASRFEVGF